MLQLLGRQAPPPHHHPTRYQYRYFCRCYEIIPLDEKNKISFNTARHNSHAHTCCRPSTRPNKTETQIYTTASTVQRSSFRHGPTILSLKVRWAHKSSARSSMDPAAPSLAALRLVVNLLGVGRGNVEGVCALPVVAFKDRAHSVVWVRTS